MKLASKAEYLFNCITDYVDAKIEYEIIAHIKDTRGHQEDNRNYVPSSIYRDKEQELLECLNEIFQEE